MTGWLAYRLDSKGVYPPYVGLSCLLALHMGVFLIFGVYSGDDFYSTCTRFAPHGFIGGAAIRLGYSQVIYNHESATLLIYSTLRFRIGFSVYSKVSPLLFAPAIRQDRMGFCTQVGNVLTNPHSLDIFIFTTILILCII
jgi:hypothetical protein